MPASREPRSRWTRLALVPPALLLALLGLANAWGVSERSVGIDFYHLWAAARARTTSLYSDAARREIMAGELTALRADARQPRRAAAARMTQRIDQGRVETLATPLLFGIVGLLPGDDYEADFGSYRLFHLATLALSVVLLCRALGYGWASALLGVGLLAGLFQPYRADLFVGNVSAPTLLMIAVAIGALHGRWRHGYALAGFILGLAVVFKPYVALAPAALVLALLAQRQTRLALSTTLAGVLGGVSGVLTGGLLSGALSRWAEWLEIVPQVLASTRSVQAGNYGVSTIIRTLWSVDVSAWLLVLLLALLVAALVRAGRAEEHRAQPDPTVGFLALSAGLLVMMLASRLVWFHYLVLALPLLLHAARPQHLADRAQRWKPSLGLLSLGLVSPFAQPLLPPSMAGALLSAAALLILLAVAVVDLASSRAGGVAAGAAAG